mmetsp:Transcript_10589/g.28193  ORF Transcript_10589/g.28193 Transcript_10589/m.28193 type:complete len:272 (-) Transcript_10589:315-1130(-)|eukprot:5610131-Prymnesium_polylepis.2
MPLQLRDPIAVELQKALQHAAVDALVAPLLLHRALDEINGDLVQLYRALELAIRVKVHRVLRAHDGFLNQLAGGSCCDASRHGDAKRAVRPMLHAPAIPQNECADAVRLRSRAGVEASLRRGGGKPLGAERSARRERIYCPLVTADQGSQLGHHECRLGVRAMAIGLSHLAQRWQLEFADRATPRSQAMVDHVRQSTHVRAEKRRTQLAHAYRRFSPRATRQTTLCVHSAQLPASQFDRTRSRLQQPREQQRVVEATARRGESDEPVSRIG